MGEDENDETLLVANHYCYPFDSECPITQMDFAETLILPIEHKYTDQSFGSPIVNIQAS
jgi:hypothetical protein